MFVARTGLERDQLERLVEDGMTIAQIAVEVGCSMGTVRHWLGRYGLKTRTVRRGTANPGLATITRTCQHHGETDFVIDGAGDYRCRRCRVEAVVRRRRKVKQLLVAEAGGGCAICGYSRYAGALAFHHVDPDEKTLAVSMSGTTLSIDFLRSEAQKCVLLCSNCHAEVEGGVTNLPIQ